MGTPGNTAPDATKAPEAKVEVTFEDKVTAALEGMVDNGSGKLVFQDGIEDSVRFAASTLKQARDNKKEYTQGQQKLAQLKAERDALNAKLTETITSSVKLSEENLAQLDAVKWSDPDAYAKMLNDLQTTAAKQAKDALDSSLKEVSAKAVSDYELTQRADILASFVAESGIVINQELIDNEIPPRITNKLRDGKVTFYEFLKEVADYATTNKVVKQVEHTPIPNIGNVTGSQTPQAGAGKDMLADYASLRM
jgi:hypothetical protein